MTFWGSVNIIVGLIAVLATMGLILQLIKRYSNRFVASKQSAPMEILHRISLTPRQGLAVVRIGIRYFAVAIGEGGVQLLTELATNDLTSIKPSVPAQPSPSRTISEPLASSSQQVTSLASRRPATKLSTANRISAPNNHETGKVSADTRSKISNIVSRKSPSQNRVSYIAPIDDFKAVLSMAMNGTDRA